MDQDQIAYKITKGKDQMIHCKRHVGPITWLAALKHILTYRRRCLFSKSRQVFEAGATRWQANKTFRDGGCQV